MKTANKPMLVHQRWKAKQAAAAAAEAGEKEGKRKADGTAYVRGGATSSSGTGWVGQVVRVIVGAVLASVFLSRAITNTWVWGYTTNYNSIDQVTNSLSLLLLPPLLTTY